MRESSIAVPVDKADYRIPFCEFRLADMKQVESLLQESREHGRLSNFGFLYSRLVERLTQELDLPQGTEALVTSSGHTALMAAYYVLDCQSIVVPDYTFSSTALAATSQGKKILTCDVGLDGSISLDSISQLDLSEYDAVCAVCPLSMIPHLEGIQDFCQMHGKKLIIDAAATFGSALPRTGDAQCISFHATKSLPGGEGGVLIASSETIQRARAYINFGVDPEASKRLLSTGINGKVSEYTCAILLSLLEQMPAAIARRRENASVYQRILGDCFIGDPVSYSPVFAFWPCFLPSEYQAEAARQRLHKNGIAYGQYYAPLMGAPVAASLYERNICLPIHPGIDRDRVEEIAYIVRG